MNNEKKKALDGSTRQYIRRIRFLQFTVFVVMSIFFILFAYRMVSYNGQSLKAVALAEVQESMKETVNNLSIHIDRIKIRLEKEAEVLLKDTAKRIEKDDITEMADILSHMEVCEENQLGQALQAIYRTSDETIYHIKNAGKEINILTALEEILYESAVYEKLEKDGQQIVLFLEQADIDELVKQEVHGHIHSEYYEGNQYVWINEVIHMEGGENYAIRRIHPNLVESEGEYLSTSMQDIKGNYPYLTELEGIRNEGNVFHSYYFKNKVNDEIMEKFSYSQYYEPFGWIIATGETLEEAYAYSEELRMQNLRQVVILMIAFVILLAITFAVMIEILTKQAKAFRSRLLKQSEILEDMYSTMSAGLLRVRMSDKESSLITINPKGLELFGIDTKEEFVARRKNNNMIDTIDEADRERLYQVYHELKEQWDSVVVECHVKWKDGTTHLLKVRNTLIEFDGDAKIIQRMCLDITEERREQEAALLQAEEKATLDPMTQIKNKRAIEMITKEHIKEAVEKELPIAVGFVDIDNFRDYNTKYGHLQGDEVIKYVASTLKETVKGDVGRTGGDEFTFCMLNPSYQTVEEAMKEMHRKLNKGISIMNTNILIPTPCSIGVVIVKGKELKYDTVLKCSDEAMYYAKEKGKNTYHILVKENM